jgi:hypothetical protein
MHVPVTDAFDESSTLKSLEVKLTPRQVEWLEQKADERDLSFDHVLRALLTKQIRESSTASISPTHSGDRSPSAPADDPDKRRSATADAEDEDGPSSIVESLRSASERLQDLTDAEGEASASDLSDTLARLGARRDASDADATEDNNDAVVVDDRGPSMFDFVEEE